MAIRNVKNYIKGEWVEPLGGTGQDTFCPATGEAIGHVTFSTPDEVDAAVRAAREAFPEWRTTPPVTRARKMFKLKNLLEERFEEAARLCTTEVGKTIDESRGEVRRAIEVVELMAGAPTLMKGQVLEDIAAGLDCTVLRQPVGVFACITPYNFPFMVSLWFLPPAIATGNTFIVKPSEQDPLCQQLLFEILDELDLPPGVVNLVNGGRDVVNAILAHPGINGVSIVGSTPTARHVYAEGARHGKRVQALGGAKNFLLVMPDAPIPPTVNALIGSCFGCAGQRCLAGSNVVAVGGIHDKLRDAVVEKSAGLKVGDGLDPTVQMGALGTRAARDKVLSFIDIGLKEGAKLLLDGRKVKPAGSPQGFFIGPTIFDEVTPGMTIAREEIFGPVLNILRADDFPSAMQMVEACPFANAGSIFTSSGKAAREFAYRVPASMCGVNIGIAAPMAYFSFGGARASFFGDLKAHGAESIDFYTDRKVVSTRWF
jgi:malonate-semialdehyde dehydrogenase (acetylating)/methylmalonate-semialdehyde dehydrogenase